jgi:rare lipoprotein A
MPSSNLGKTSIIFVVLLLASCAPKEKPFTGVKIGKPYEINGKMYYPSPDDYYDKIGDASWYGPGFHGNRTASGEVFDQNDITAAHPTLPMPSLVRVTNLGNEKSIVVRVNDRGPYHSNRIIDLSKKSAEMIDMKSTRPVRVQFLKEETDEYIASIEGKSPRIDMVAYNDEYNKKLAERNAMTAQLIESSAPVQSVARADIEKPSSNFFIGDASANENTTIPVNLSAPAQAPQKPSVEIKTENKPVVTTLKPTATGEKYIILAGSFSAQENAQKLARSLTSIDNHNKLTVIDNVTVGGKEWWRVHVGPFSDRDKAEKALKIVHDTGTRDARISRQK